MCSIERLIGTEIAHLVLRRKFDLILRRADAQPSEAALKTESKQWFGREQCHRKKWADLVHLLTPHRKFLGPWGFPTVGT